ncbi:MAG: T9SS type A sorting domain-containing protein, partial [Bacteroidota bacterium]
DQPVLESVRSELMVTSGESIRLLSEQFVFSDPDNQSLLDFSVIISEGDNYTFEGDELTPVVDFTGTLNVPVKISDGITESNEIIASITVNKVTDASQSITSNTIKLFPVPTNDLINVRLNNQYSGTVKFTILDQAGRQIRTMTSRKNTREMNQPFDIREFIQGVYYFEVQVEGFVVRKRFVK